MEAYIRTCYKLSDFLDDEEIIETWQIYNSGERSTVTNRLTQYLEGRIKVISERVGHDCEPRYVAYVLMFAFMEMTKKMKA